MFSWGWEGGRNQEGDWGKERSVREGLNRVHERPQPQVSGFRMDVETSWK